MWFRPGHNNNNTTTNNGEKVSTTTEPIVDKFDKFRVSSLKRRMRNVGRKSQTPEKSSTPPPPPVIVKDDVIPPKIPEETKSIQDEIDCVVTKLDVGRLKIKAKTDLPTRKIISKPIIHEKEKILLTDRKFKNNRIVKSSSKGKISDLDNLKSGRNNRKISIDATKLVNNGDDNSENNTSASGIPVPVNKKHHIRANSTINLNALYKLVSNSNAKKNLTSEDFDRIRRKSLSEAASSTAATIKPAHKTSITSMKYADDDGVATYSEVDDSNNVVLVKHDTKTDSCDSLNFNTVNSSCDDDKTITENFDDNLKHDKINDVDEKTDIIMNGNNNPGDENYSCDEDDDNEEENCEDGVKSNDKNDGNKSKIQKPSPSLTSRVAAKIYETTNSYKNRKSKSPKKRKNPRRSEFYKQISVDRLHSTSVVRHPSDRRPDLANSSISSSSVGTQSHNTSELQTSQSLDADSNALDAEQDSKTRDNRSKSKSAPVSVNRSESYKDRLTQKRLRSNRRKTSDPSLTKTNDEQQSELGLSNANFTASSSSSLSSGGSLESPSTSLEQVGGGGSTGGTPIYNQHHHQHSSHHPQHHSHHHGGTATPTGPLSTATGTVLTPRLWVDSDDEDNINEADWSSNIQVEILASLTDTEKKRQEIINEIFQTERSHVRTLRVLEGIFYRPLKETGVLPSDHLQLLFPPALLSLKDLHLTFEQQLKARRIEHNHIVKNVGDLLITMFEGISGDELRDNAMQFCARQQIALEALKEKRRKDENLQRFLTKAESHKACRRLQLKDLLPTVLQRLTKYPLLFENLLKISIRVNPDDKLEADTIQRALDSSKRILVDVNQAVKFAEDTHKLQTIQRKLDKSSFDKESSNEFKNLDLTQYKLVHDGQLTMKKNPGVQLHGLLFENMMVLVQKQDDKYFLKYFPNVAAGTNENNKLISPITHFDQQTFVRQSAVDKNTFFVIITKTSQMLELRAPSSSECKTWFKHISEAAEQYKPRSKNNQDVVEDPASATLPHSNTKESLEGTPERTSIPTTIQSTERSSTPLHNNSINSIDSGNNNLSGLQQSGHQKQPNNNNSIIGGEKRNRDDCGNNNDEQSQNIDKLSHDSTISNILVGDHQQQQQNSDRRDSIYSNNSNNTRTLMQHCPLLEPSEIQISISPAHTAEPIVTPTEQLRRLDEKIRNDLAEKQKIICDMFRVPNEHFMAIVDIVGQPEAPKDSSDICLAAFAQVQSLTEVLTEYMTCTPEQEISAVSTAVCDQCHHINNHQRRLSSLSLTPGGTGCGNSIGNGGLRSLSPLQSSIASTNTGTTIIQKQNNFDETPTSSITTPTVENSSNCNNSVKLNNFIIEKSNELIDEPIIHEDDDGYCEIDELRLPSVQTTNSSVGYKQIGNNSNSSNNNCGGNGNTVPNSSSSNNSNNNNQSSSPPELLKRQSTISADSIPEESEQDITQEEDTTNSVSKSLSSSNSKGKDDGDDNKDNNEQEQHQINKENIFKTNKVSSEDDSLNSEHIEINDTYDTTASVNKITSISNLVYHENNPFSEGGVDVSINEIHHLCGPNRLAHVNTLEPSIPCHIVNGFVTALNTQISLLLPKINERDLERERLRKENQHLRELLNAMHERKRVEDEKETPENVAKSTEISSSSGDSEASALPLPTTAQDP